MLTQQAENLISEFAERSKKILRDNLVGIYLHGSAVMGCFNPDKSDLDFIIVIKKPLTDAVKKAYLDMVIELSDLGPAKGIEMSIVLQDVCSPFVYPTPFDLHFSVAHADWYRANPREYICKMNGTDKDLAAHFTIIRRRGKCLCGAPIDGVFAEVSGHDYMDSIWGDIESAEQEIADNTMYLTLNLARVLAYGEKGLVLSKKEGGEWAINSLPQEFRPLILDALREYLGSASIVYDQALARRYAKYAIRRITLSQHLS